MQKAAKLLEILQPLLYQQEQLISEIYTLAPSSLDSLQRLDQCLEAIRDLGGLISDFKDTDFHDPGLKEVFSKLLASANTFHSNQIGQMRRQLPDYADLAEQNGNLGLAVNLLGRQLVNSQQNDPSAAEVSARLRKVLDRLHNFHSPADLDALFNLWQRFELDDSYSLQKIHSTWLPWVECLWRGKEDDYFTAQPSEQPPKRLSHLAEYSLDYLLALGFCYPDQAKQLDPYVAKAQQRLFAKAKLLHKVVALHLGEDGTTETSSPDRQRYQKQRDDWARSVLAKAGLGFILVTEESSPKLSKQANCTQCFDLNSLSAEQKEALNVVSLGLGWQERKEAVFVNGRAYLPPSMTSSVWTMEQESYLAQVKRLAENYEQGRKDFYQLLQKNSGKFWNWESYENFMQGSYLDPSITGSLYRQQLNTKANYVVAHGRLLREHFGVSAHWKKASQAAEQQMLLAANANLSEQEINALSTGLTTAVIAPLLAYSYPLTTVGLAAFSGTHRSVRGGTLARDTGMPDPSYYALATSGAMEAMALAPLFSSRFLRPALIAAGIGNTTAATFNSATAGHYRTLTIDLATLGLLACAAKRELPSSRPELRIYRPPEAEPHILAFPVNNAANGTSNPAANTVGSLALKPANQSIPLRFYEPAGSPRLNPVPVIFPIDPSLLTTLTASSSKNTDEILPLMTLALPYFNDAANRPHIWQIPSTHIGGDYNDPKLEHGFAHSGRLTFWQLYNNELERQRRQSSSSGKHSQDPNLLRMGPSDSGGQTSAERGNAEQDVASQPTSDLDTTVSQLKTLLASHETNSQALRIFEKLPTTQQRDVVRELAATDETGKQMQLIWLLLHSDRTKEQRRELALTWVSSVHPRYLHQLLYFCHHEATLNFLVQQAKNAITVGDQEKSRRLFKAIHSLYKTWPFEVLKAEIEFIILAAQSTHDCSELSKDIETFLFALFAKRDFLERFNLKQLHSIRELVSKPDNSSLFEFLPPVLPEVKAVRTLVSQPEQFITAKKAAELYLPIKEEEPIVIITSHVNTTAFYHQIAPIPNVFPDGISATCRFLKPYIFSCPFRKYLIYPDPEHLPTFARGSQNAQMYGPGYFYPGSIAAIDVDHIEDRNELLLRQIQCCFKIPGRTVMTRNEIETISLYLNAGILPKFLEMVLREEWSRNPERSIKIDLPGMEKHSQLPRNFKLFFDTTRQMGCQTSFEFSNDAYQFTARRPE